MRQFSFASQRLLSSVRWGRARRLVLTVIVLVTIAGAQSTEKVIATITSPSPNGGMVFDQKGNLYGTGLDSIQIASLAPYSHFTLTPAVHG